MPERTPLVLEPRQWQRETPLREARSILIGAPAEGSGRQAAVRLADALRAEGLEAQVLPDPSPEVMTAAEGPLFVLGNLANSRCVRDLYYRFLCATDRRYPGPGGYELRTLLDPFGTGHNLVHLGYSEDAGLEAGLHCLLERLEDPVPWLSEIRATCLPLSPDEATAFAAHRLPSLDWQAANCQLGDQKGYLGYLTGDGDLVAKWARYWRMVIGCGYERNEKIVQTHLFMLSRVMVWRLLEVAGLVPEELRQPIVQFIYEWAESAEGFRHIEHPTYQSPYYPRQNHGLVPALALAYAADHFRTHYPQLTELARWQTVAAGVYAPYASSWKPVCDGLCHGWYMSQPLMLEYALLDPEHRYFEAGGARQAADCAVAVVNNQGWMPNAGDADIARAFPGPSLRIAAAYYGEGKYRFVHDLAPRGLNLAWQEAPPRSFDTGLPPEAPQPGTSVTVIPMDPLIYHVWEREPLLAPGATDTPPTAPLAACFDKLAVRAGWGFDDDYLLLDGLGGGSHSYADAGAVLDYARFGLSCLVPEDVLIFTAPEHHNMVTVTRDGEMGAIPSFSALEANEMDAEGNVYLRLRLEGCAGADWVREVFFRRGRGVVFHDSVLAREAGAYAVEAHFRTPASAELAGACLISRRHSTTVGEVEFRLLSLADPSRVRVEELPFELICHQVEGEPLPLSHSEDRAALYRERYQTDRPALSAFAARATAQLSPGGAVSLTHLAQIRGPGEPELNLRVQGAQLVLSDGREAWTLPCHHPPVTAAAPSAVPVRAPTSSLEPERLLEAAAAVTCLKAHPRGGALGGTADGRLFALDADGAVLWSRRLPGPIHDIGVAEGAEARVAVGHGAAALTCLDAGGATLWERTILREPCPWPWWELATPMPVQVAGGVFDGEMLFAVGCGDIQVRLFDAEGTQRWRWRYNEGVPGRIRIADVDGDGVPEIVVGGDILTDVSNCRLLTHRGEVKAELGVEGWTSALKAVDWATVDGRPLLACGADRGRTLHLFDLSGLRPGGDRQPRRLFVKLLGGSVNGLRLGGEPAGVLVGTSQGFLQSYTLDGQCRWSRLLEGGISAIAPLGDRSLVVERDGRCHVVTGECHEEGHLEAGRPWRCFASTASGVWFASGREVWRV